MLPILGAFLSAIDFIALLYWASFLGLALGLALGLGLGLAPSTSVWVGGKKSNCPATAACLFNLACSAAICWSRIVRTFVGSNKFCSSSGTRGAAGTVSVGTGTPFSGSTAILPSASLTTCCTVGPVIGGCS